MKQVKTWILVGLLAVVLTATASCYAPSDTNDGLSVVSSFDQATEDAFQKGLDAYKAKNYTDAFAEFAPLAEAGYVKAQFYLGEMYRQGNGALYDTVRAFKWYRLAAEAGDYRAQYHLGSMYDDGAGGVREDNVEAVKWYRRAAEAGHAQAQGFLGLKYQYGDGVPQDFYLAYMWSNLAVGQGFHSAMSIRDEVANIMTSWELAEAQEMSRRCLAQNYKGC